MAAKKIVHSKIWSQKFVFRASFAISNPILTQFAPKYMFLGMPDPFLTFLKLYNEDLLPKNRIMDKSRL